MHILLLIALFCAGSQALPFPDKVNQPYNGTIWAVLTAGSNGYYNYRHQADIYHAYQLLRSHGIPEKNIIVFHYDDIANNSQNPNKGIVINKPGGSDVYHGVPKDFTGKDVTPENFLAVLKGDSDLKASGKKVVESGPNDHIFVFFDDHGGPDTVSFPHSILHGKQLNDALKEMHQNKRYGKLVFYLEACYAGSMFEKYLDSSMNIFVTTAANSHQSSYACYYDSTVHTYVGDLYSVNWMENSDEVDIWGESLQKQFEIVKQKTNKSVVCEFGDLNMAQLPVAEFQGPKKMSEYMEERVVPKDAVPSQDVPILVAQQRLLSAQNDLDKQIFADELDLLVKGRQMLDNHFEVYVDSVYHLISGYKNEIINGVQKVNNVDCYYQLTDTFHNKCLNIGENTYALQKLNIFVNICEDFSKSSDESVKTAEAVDRLEDYCQHMFVLSGDHLIV
ncbi:legumain-like [Oppia nitens]|uniref:legumain-like n=1 Tax=Oppia nitens TaxID=1686743 RepID=UPI0023D9EC38|nr:legumain-like [Oppia nitens]